MSELELSQTHLNSVEGLESEETVVRQQGLFTASLVEPESSLPEGFRYQPEFLDSCAEAQLVQMIETLELKPFEFHGYLGNRRVVSFGLRYNYDRREVLPAPEPPAFLDSLRAKAAEFGGFSPHHLKQVGINEYRAGAGIGWHRDKPEFGDVIGVSLVSPAKMRFRERHGQQWIRQVIVVEPRSIYVLSGPARMRWEHSIPPVSRLRYSIMFRTLVGTTRVRSRG
jgi:alkylated DNA repair dioxygenase AlkB